MDLPVESPKIVLPDVRMNAVRPNAPVMGRVVTNEKCTSGKASGFVRHVAIDVGGTPLEGAFRAGQSFGVIPPGTDERGKPHAVRLYSIASPTGGEDGAGKVLATTVKRTVDEHWDDHRLFLGVASNYLCDLQEGDEALVSGPNGKRFLLPQNVEAHDYVFIATGTGIAPFRGMLIDLLESGCTRSITLIMGAPYKTDLLYHDFFLRKQSENENFSYLTAISRHAQEDGEKPMYVDQRLVTHREQLGPILSSDQTLIYICGIAGMEVGVFQALAQTLTPSALEGYLEVDAEAMTNMRSWSRKMLNRQIKPTKRVFLEVY